MKSRLWLAALLALAPMAWSQDSAKGTKEDAKPATEAPAAEAHRQSRVAMTPNAASPKQSMSQAIAFEKYKEMAAQREAQKESKSTSADRSIDKPKKK